MSRTFGTLVAVLFVVQLTSIAPASAEVLPSHWYAFHTKTFSASINGDVIAAGPRPLSNSWTFDITRPYGEPAWDADLHVTTQLAPADASWYPNTVTFDVASHTYARTARTDSMYTSVYANAMSETAELGFTATRALVEGRDIPVGIGIVRTFDVVVTPTSVVRSLDVSVPLWDAANAPVKVVASTCAGAWGGPSYWYWSSVDPVPGLPLTFSCTLTLDNTAGAPARYMPQLSVRTVRGIERVDSPGATSVTVADTLGTTVLAVTPPADAAPFGHLDRFEEYRAWLQPENTLAVRDWSASFLRGYSGTVAGDASVDPMPLVPGWALSIYATPPAIPAHLRVTTPLDLYTYPLATKTPADGGWLYSWDGATPFFTASLGPNDHAPVTASTGFVAQRTLTGGRRIGAHTTQSKTFDLQVDTTAAMLSLSVLLGLDPVAMPGTASGAGALSIRDAVCPGATAPTGGPGWAWMVDAPAVGARADFACTFTIQNTGDDDVFYMPSVYIRSNRDFVSGTPAVGASHLAVTEPGLGLADFSVDIPAPDAPRGQLGTIDIRSVSMWPEARLAPRATTLTVFSGASYSFGFVGPLGARLTESKTGTGLAGQVVHLTIDEQSSGAAYSTYATTDAAGNATFAPVPTLRPGSYTLHATFAETTAYLGSTGEASFAVVNTSGRVLGSFLTLVGDRGVIAVQSSTTEMHGTFAFSSDRIDYTAATFIGFGISGTSAALLMADANGTLAILFVEDLGEPSPVASATPTRAPATSASPGPTPTVTPPPAAVRTEDRLSLVIGGFTYSGGRIASGNLQVMP